MTPEKGPRMPQDRVSPASATQTPRWVREALERRRNEITYPFETDIERAERIAQAALWEPQGIIDGKGPPRCHKLKPGSESVAYCGRTFGPGTRQPSPTPPGAYLCRVCLRLNGGPF